MAIAIQAVDFDIGGVLDVELRDFLARLRPAYTTAILSNSADGARREENRRHGFEDLVDTIFHSHDLGLAKPDPATYRVTHGRLVPGHGHQ